MKRPKNIFACCLIGILLLLSGHCFAEERASMFDSYFSPGNAFSYGYAVEPGSKNRPRITSNSLRGSAVVAQQDDDTWTVTGRANRVTLNKSIPIPVPPVLFPDSLWDIQGGLGFRRRLEQGRLVGVNGAIGSASNKPFHSIHETEIQTTGSYLLPRAGGNMWIFLLTYSNNRAFANNIPLPGAAYFWRSAAPGLSLTLGFPFIVANYVPNENWAAKATLFGSTNQSAEVSRRLGPVLHAYTAIEHNPQTWFRANREDNGHRLVLNEKKFLIGLRAPVNNTLTFDAAVGSVYGRHLYEAKTVDARNPARTSLRSGSLLQLSASLRFSGSSSKK